MTRLLLLAIVLLSPWTESMPAHGATPGAIVGTVTYRQRVALPPDAIVEVRLQDTSRADASARTLGHAIIPTAGAQVPIPFRIEYDPAAINPSHSYSVRATITVGDRLLFTSTTAYPVLTQGGGNEATIAVFMILPKDGPVGVPAAEAASTAPVALENTQWKLVSIGNAAAVALPAGRDAGINLHAGDRRLSGSGGCNRLVGSYDVAAGTLRIAPAGTTMMACPKELMDQENDFLTALTMTTDYRIAGDMLELRNGERVLARFMAQNSK